MLKTKNRAASRLRTAKPGRPSPAPAGTKTRRTPAHPDPDVVKQAEKIFAAMGMTPYEAVALFYKQTALHGQFPITELIPNEITQAAIRDALAGIGIIRGRTVAQMLAEAESEYCAS